MKVNIFSLNIACAFRDENVNPLYKRLDILIEYIKKSHEQNPFDIMCIQEVRPTGSLKAIDVIDKLRGIFGWEYTAQKVNPSANSFHRVTFWNQEKYSLHSTETHYTPNFREPQFCYALMKSNFVETNSETNEIKFNVINAHASLVLNEKKLYWEKIKSVANKKSIIVGDMNKFEEHLDEYNKIFNIETGFVDHILPDQMTFYSFDTDLKSDGTHFISSLDAVIVSSEIKDCKVTIISTQATPRPTDHFGIHAQVTINNTIE